MSRRLTDVLTDTEAEVLQEAVRALEDASLFIAMDKSMPDHFMVTMLEQVARRLDGLLD